MHMAPSDLAGERRQRLDRLEALGFYQYTPIENIARAKAYAEETGLLFKYVPERSLGDPDFEEIDEGKADEFLHQVLPILSLRGVTIKQIESDFYQSDPRTYALILDGLRHVLFRTSQDPAQPETEPPDLSLINLLNARLKEAGSQDRIYFGAEVTGNPNCQSLVLLTPAMHDVLMEEVELWDCGGRYSLLKSGRPAEEE